MVPFVSGVQQGIRSLFDTFSAQHRHRNLKGLQHDPLLDHYFADWVICDGQSTQKSMRREKNFERNIGEFMVSFGFLLFRQPLGRFHDIHALHRQMIISTASLLFEIFGSLV